MLSGKRGVVVRGKMVTLHKEPKADAPPTAFAKPGVIGKLMKCKLEWCQVDMRGNRGWLIRKEVWGVYADEKVE
jgi:SH3-like domain-containing protein